jgi:hypothetical protein
MAPRTLARLRSNTVLGYRKSMPGMDRGAGAGLSIVDDADLRLFRDLYWQRDWAIA